MVSTDFVHFRARLKEALSGAAAVTSEPLYRSDTSVLYKAISSLLTGYSRSFLPQMFSFERTKRSDQEQVALPILQSNAFF